MSEMSVLRIPESAIGDQAATLRHAQGILDGIRIHAREGERARIRPIFSGLTALVPTIVSGLIGTTALGEPTINLGSFRGWPEEFAGLGVEEAVKLSCEPLRHGRATSSPTGIRPIPKTKGGYRFICAPTIPDRLLQRAMYEMAQRIFMPTLPQSCYGFVPGLGTHDAVDALRQLLDSGAFATAVIVDIKRCYASIPVKGAVRRLAVSIDDDTFIRASEDAISARPTHAAIRRIRRELLGTEGVTSETLDTLKRLHQRRIGLSEGSNLAPLAMLRYLTPFTIALEKLPNSSTVQYADDLVVMLKNNDTQPLNGVLAKAGRELGLTFHTEVVRWEEGASIDFLSYRLIHAGDASRLTATPEATRRIAGKVAKIVESDDQNGNRHTDHTDLVHSIVDQHRYYAPLCARRHGGDSPGEYLPPACKNQGHVH